jgi:hypothetical protein
MSELILYTTEDGRSQIKLRVDQQTVWLTQLETAELFDATKQNISLHLKNVFQDGELDPAAGFCRIGFSWPHRMSAHRRAQGQHGCSRSKAGA